MPFACPKNTRAGKRGAVRVELRRDERTRLGNGLCRRRRAARYGIDDEMDLPRPVGAFARALKSVRIVKDNAERVARSAAQFADTVPQVDSMKAVRARRRPLVNGEDHGIPLA